MSSTKFPQSSRALGGSSEGWCRKAKDTRVTIAHEETVRWRVHRDVRLVPHFTGELLFNIGKGSKSSGLLEKDNITTKFGAHLQTRAWMTELELFPATPGDAVDYRSQEPHVRFLFIRIRGSRFYSQGRCILISLTVLYTLRGRLLAAACSATSYSQD